MDIKIPIGDEWTDVVIEAISTNYGYTPVIEQGDKVIDNPVSRIEFVASVFNTFVYQNVYSYKLALAQDKVKQDVKTELTGIISDSIS